MRALDPYAFDVVRQLWPGRPGPVVTRRPGPPPAGTLQWWLVPSPRRARLLVPVSTRQAAVMLNRHGGGSRKAARTVLSALVSSSVLRMLPAPRLELGSPEDDGSGGSEGSVGDLVCELIGKDAAAGVLLGPPRANRKPVVQVFGADGMTRAFVKIGTDDVTRALVRREAECLRQVHATGLDLVRAPAVLHAGSVGELEVLVLSPLASSQAPGRAPGPPPLDAMVEVASANGVTSEPLKHSDFWLSTVGSAAQVGDPVYREALESVIDAVTALRGSTPLTTGSWHGDWAPWNMGFGGGRVEVWDWERFGPAPFGFDLVHYLAQSVRHGSADVAAQESAFVDGVPAALQGMGPHGRAQDPDLVVLCYLITICLRFGFDAHRGPRPGPHPRSLWALDLAERLVGEPGRHAGAS